MIGDNQLDEIEYRAQIGGISYAVKVQRCSSDPQRDFMTFIQLQNGRSLQRSLDKASLLR